MLVAGFGNLLLGDDGFGVRVLERLGTKPLPSGVELLEVGTGGLNLVLTLMGGFSDLVVVDAVRHGRAPGTLCTFHPAAPGKSVRRDRRRPSLRGADAGDGPRRRARDAARSGHGRGV